MGKLLIGVCIAAIYAMVQLLLRRRRRASYPPGPPGVPFFGNLFQLSEDLWVPFTAWKQQYGENTLSFKQPLVTLLQVTFSI
jgi:hypothetical protein